MYLSTEYIESLHSGHVLHRVGKKKYRVVKPAFYKVCDVCGKTIHGNTVKFEGSGNVTLFVMCPECAVLELED
jgi:hypothetical protein